MKTKFLLLTLLCLLISCDDGDIVVSEFEFDSEDLDFCHTEETNETVFFNANDTDELIYAIIDLEFDGLSENIEEISVNGSNVFYKKFNESINTNLIFCNAISTSYATEDTFTGESGTIYISTIVVVDEDEEEDNNTLDGDNDLDNDGLSNTEEGYAPNSDAYQDSDADSIPDYLDEDDDNDNVPTSQELLNGEPQDTDGDGIDDHLDTDDDEDGILTKYEVTETYQDPTSIFNRNDDGVYYYLDVNSNSEMYVHDIQLANTFKTYYYTIVNLTNLELTNNNESVTYNILNLGTFTLNEDTDYQVVIDTNENITVSEEQANGDLLIIYSSPTENESE